MLTFSGSKLAWTDYSPYVFIEGTIGTFFQGVEVLKRTRGEAHHQIQMLRAPRHDVEVVTDGNGGGLVHTFVYWMLQIGNLRQTHKRENIRLIKLYIYSVADES